MGGNKELAIFDFLNWFVAFRFLYKDDPNPFDSPAGGREAI